MNDERDVDNALQARSERGVHRGADAVLAAGQAAAAKTESLPTARSLLSSRRRRPASIAAAALVAAAIAGGAFAWRSSDEGNTTVRNDTSALCAALSAPAFPIRSDLLVYVDPGASDSTRAQIDAALGADPRVESRRYIDQSETSAEFERLFRARREMLENVGPEDLPTSFEVQLVDPADAPALAASFRALPGVFEARGTESFAATARVLDVLVAPGVNDSIADAGGQGRAILRRTERLSAQIAAVRAAADPETASAVDALAIAFQTNQPLAKHSPERAALAPSAQLLVEVAESRCQLRLQPWVATIGQDPSVPSIPSEVTEQPSGN